jgi:hypothetical protein
MAFVPTAQEFYVQSLNIDITADTLNLHGGDDTVDNFLAHATAELKVPVSWAIKTFQYTTDGRDVDNQNKNDIKFRVFSTHSTHGGISVANNNLKYFNPKNIIPGHAGPVENNYVPVFNYSNFDPNEKTVAADYPRHVSLELFGTSAGVDLFNNERQVRSEIVKDSSSAFVTKMLDLGNAANPVGSKIHYIDTETEDWIRMITDSLNINTTQYDTEVKQTQAIEKGMYHPTRVMFAQMLDNQTDRFDNIDEFEGRDLVHYFLQNGTAATGVDNQTKKEDIVQTNNEPLWRGLPFAVGDKIYFKLTINPGQNNKADGTDTSVRRYKIKLTLVADEDPTVTSEDTTAGHYVWGWTDAGYDHTQDLYPYATAQMLDSAPDNVEIP